MSPLDALFVLCGGAAAGAINVLVGSGTLITFPVLLAVGFPPVVANVSNTIGLVPGSLAGAWGYRRELQGQRRRVSRLLVASVGGGATGALLLLVLPAAAFKSIVPVFIVLALVLVVLQPRVSRALAARGHGPQGMAGAAPIIGLYLCGVYGGYFGAAQGIIVLALLGFLAHQSLQHANAIKNVLAGATNLVAGIIFAVAAPVSWEAATIIAVGSTIGGLLGARLGRRLQAPVLRGLIVVVGCAAIAQLLR
ncbi:MAG TPA: sulfite exporter TauE/SafE family protein [Gaiellaceae bacterium]|nr:sulfite exporter TauE/SafE family protein [Gaiellaceae bacterium]